MLRRPASYTEGTQAFTLRWETPSVISSSPRSISFVIFPIAIVLPTHLSEKVPPEEKALTFVSEREPSELGVVREFLHANETRGFDQSYDPLTPLRELWWLLRLPASGLVEIVEERREGDLLGQSVHMHDRGITRADDILVIQNRQLGLKLTNCVDWSVWARQDESRRDVLVIYPPNPGPDVVTRNGNVYLLFYFVVYRGHLDRNFVWHQDEGITLAQMS